MALADHSHEATDPLLVRPVDLGDAVTSAIRELILSGIAAPGERLVEAELSSRFGTSRGPVRDAFKELEKSGLVVSLPRRGTFVATMTATDMHEIYTLRLSLEKLAIKRTAMIATNDDIAIMRAAIDKLTVAQRAGDRRAGAEADIAIHRLIVRLAGHERLTEAWERLADQTLLLMAEMMDLLLDVQHAAGDHNELVNAIAAHDPAAAEAALEAHLLAASQTMIDSAARDRVD